MERNLEVLSSIPQLGGGGDSDESWEDQSSLEISTISLQLPKKKRGKISSNACNKCKRDKKKCNGDYETQSSCSYCLDHNEKCTYSEPGRRRSKSNPDVENQSNVENNTTLTTRIPISTNPTNLSHINQVDNMFKDQLFQLFVNPSTTVDQFLLLKRLWNEMNNHPNDNRFDNENIITLYSILTMLVENCDNAIQQYPYWERIRQIVEGVVNIPNVISTSCPCSTTSCSSAPVIQSSIFPYDTTDQNTSQPEDETVVPSQPLPDFLTVQYNDNSDNFQHSSTTQDNNSIQFFDPLIDFNENNRRNDPKETTKESPKQEEKKPKRRSSQIVKERQQESEQNPKPRSAKSNKNRPEKKVQVNESTGSTRTTRRKPRPSPYSSHVHIMYRPVKPESKTSLVFHKEDPIDNSVVFESQQNSFQTKNQFTSTISEPSQYQQRQPMHLSFEQWNSGSTNVFSNQQISQQKRTSPFSIFSDLSPEPLTYYMNTPMTNVSTGTRNTDSAEIDLILGHLNEQL